MMMMARCDAAAAAAAIYDFVVFLCLLLLFGRTRPLQSLFVFASHIDSLFFSSSSSSHGRHKYRSLIHTHKTFVCLCSF